MTTPSEAISEEPGGLSVLDAVAFVTGGAVASVHIRATVPDQPGPLAWAGLALMFGWVSLASTGPFLYLLRRFARHQPGYPRPGDRLWGLAGIPWVVSGLVRTATSPHLDPAVDRVYTWVLGGSLGLAIALGLWLLASRRRAGGEILSTRPDWTEWAGLVTTALWPLQALSAFVVLGG